MKHILFSLAIMFFVLPYHQASERAYKQTVLTPHLKVRIGESDNVVYTSSFHMAWKMLQNKILKEEVKTAQNIPLVGYLNSSQPAKIDEKHSVNMAGFVSDGIASEIDRAMLNKFNRTVDLSDYTDRPSNIICYSFFKKALLFKTKFETFGQPFPFYSGGNQSDVECFGIWNAGKSEQHQGIRELVKVIDFQGTHDFIVSIGNPDDNDELIVAVLKPEETLSGMVETVFKRKNNTSPSNLEDGDRLIIPKVIVDISKKYMELYGVHLKNKGFEDYFFAEAIHDVNFTLNESGAFADSEAKLVLKKGPGPRTMMVNRPFLLMMREKKTDAPYLAVWIANPELLVEMN